MEESFAGRHQSLPPPPGIMPACPDTRGHFKTPPPQVDKIQSGVVWTIPSLSRWLNPPPVGWVTGFRVTDVFGPGGSDPPGGREKIVREMGYHWPKCAIKD